MNILNLFRKKPRNNKEITERKLLFFGKPYEAKYLEMYNELYQKGRSFDGKPCTISPDKLLVHRVFILHQWEWN